MAERLDALMTREYQSGGETKTAFTKIGVAFQTKNGGWAVKLEAMPTPQLNRDGQPETSFLLMPPRERDDTQSTGYPPNKDSRASVPPAFEGGTVDDTIPF